MTPTEINAFWRSHARFLQCTLTTEMPHPDTANLSQLAQSDLPIALSTLHQVDLKMLAQLPSHLTTIKQLSDVIQQTLAHNGRIYILGCGASGRMAVCLESAWRAQNSTEQVIGVIAGGDFALVRSIEQFEDQPELGVQQLKQQGFGQNDLLIATTASGESSFVLAAIDYAAQHCRQTPWLIYCNPNTELLKRNPKHMLSRADIKSWCLNVGSMALTGSTRMQATTAMQLALGLALLSEQPDQDLSAFISAFEQLDITPLTPFIDYESTHCQTTPNMPFIYQCDTNTALTVMTDLTERTPTFNIPPLAHYTLKQTNPPWYQLQIEQSQTHQQAWNRLLHRTPYCLQWPAFSQTSKTALQGFQFTQSAIPPDLVITHPLHWHIPKISHHWAIPCTTLKPFYQQLINKILLNIYSTLIMGKLGYYQGNIMTHLQPTNHKLIDRAIRYVQYCYQQQTHMQLDYRIVADIVLDEMTILKPNHSIVTQCLNRLKTGVSKQ